MLIARQGLLSESQGQHDQVHASRHKAMRSCIKEHPIRHGSFVAHAKTRGRKKET